MARFHGRPDYAATRVTVFWPIFWPIFLPSFLTLIVVSHLPALATLPDPMYIPFPDAVSFTSFHIHPFVAVLDIDNTTDTPASLIGWPWALLTTTSKWLSPVLSAEGCVSARCSASPR